jgi:hypothetical protein
MSKGEVVVKGEVHASEADQAETQSLLQQGVDYLVLENAAEASEPGLRYLWFHVQMWCLTHFFFRRIYTDPTPLEEVVKKQDGKVVYTRKTDLELIMDAKWWEESIAFVGFLACWIGTPLMGITGGNQEVILGGMIFTLGGLLPPIFLRVRESERGENNRDENTAGKIVDVARDGNRVVALIGNRHVDAVVSHLPDSINPTRKDAASTWYQPRGIWLALKAGVTVLALYGALYLGVVGGSRLLLQLLGVGS